MGYVEVHDLAPGRALTVSREDDQLFQECDNLKVELIPEVTGVFCREGIEGRILSNEENRER